MPRSRLSITISSSSYGNGNIIITNCCHGCCCCFIIIYYFPPQHRPLLTAGPQLCLDPSGSTRQHLSYFPTGCGFRPVNVHGRIGAEPTLPAAVVGEGDTQRLAKRCWLTAMSPEGKTRAHSGERTAPHPPQMRVKKLETWAKGKTPFCTDLL